jgi:hypothetical protein
MAATYTVIDNSNTTGPTVPPDCPAGCSLHQAIQAAVSKCDTAATIVFSGPFTISPSQAFPAVSNNCPGVQTAIVIDGGGTANTLPVGFDANLPVVLSGTSYVDLGMQSVLRTANFGYGEGGLWIKGLEIRNFTYGGAAAIRGAVKVTGSRILNNSTGMQLTAPSQIGGGGFANRNIISGNNGNAGIVASGLGSIAISDNYIGTTDSGTSANPNYYGILVGNAGPGLAIQGNVISGNLYTAITMHDSASATIQSNFIGVGPGGVSLQNGGDAMELRCLTSSTISGNQIGANVYGGILPRRLHAEHDPVEHDRLRGRANRQRRHLPRTGVLRAAVADGGLFRQGPGARSQRLEHHRRQHHQFQRQQRHNRQQQQLQHDQEQHDHQQRGHGVQVSSATGNKISQNSIYGNTGKNIDLDFYGGPLPNDIGPARHRHRRQQPPEPSRHHARHAHLPAITQITWNLTRPRATTTRWSSSPTSPPGTPAGKTFIAPPGPPIIAPTDAEGDFGQTIQFAACTTTSR